MDVKISSAYLKIVNHGSQPSLDSLYGVKREVGEHPKKNSEMSKKVLDKPPDSYYIPHNEWPV